MDSVLLSIFTIFKTSESCLKMKKSPFFFVLIFLYNLCSTQSISAQDFRLLHVNADNFPVIEGIFSLDQANSKYLPNSPNTDFNISENNKSLEILNIVNPSASELPLSIILAIDASGSMNKERIQIVKNAAINFINRVPLEISEIAVLSFNDQVIVNSDFTHNKSRLIGAIQSLEAFGGTNYNEAFLNTEIGAIKVGSLGNNQKIIVFLTDGLSNIAEDTIISEAIDKNIAVFSITVELDMPESLKNISKRTGGKYYETMQSEGEVGNVYNSIVYTIQSELYGHVFWRAPYGCERDRTGILNYQGYDFPYSYNVPPQSASKIRFDQDELSFGDILPGESGNMDFTIEVFDNPIILNKIDISKNSFSLTEKTFGDILFPEQKNKLSISYTSVEEGLNTAKLTFNIENCPQKTLTLKGGMAEKIEIIYPNAGEIFSVEKPIDIKWKGIKSNRIVDIYYRNQDTAEWKYISSADNQFYSWQNHSDTGLKMQLRIQPRSILKPDFISKTKISINNSRPISADINPQNGQLLYLTERGDAFLLNLNNRNYSLSARGLGRQDIFFTKTGKIASVDRDQITLHDNRGLTITSFRNEGMVANAITLNNGQEILTYSKIRKLNPGSVEIRSIFSDTYDTLVDSDPIEFASTTLDGDKAVSVHKSGLLKIWHKNNNTFFPAFASSEFQNSKIILSPDNHTAICILDNQMSMIDLNSGNKLFVQQGYKYAHFSKSGNLFVAYSTDSSVNIFETYNGNLITKFDKYTKIQTFKNSSELVYYQNDTLYFYNPTNNKSVNKYTPELANFLISPNDSKILLLFTNGHQILIDSRTFNRISEFTLEPAERYLAVFSEINNDIILFIDNRLIEVWTPEYQAFTDDISKQFSIVQPRIKTTDSIDAGQQFVNTSKEYYLQNLYKNTGWVTASISNIKLSGNDTSEFELVNGINKDSLIPGEFADAEIRFNPQTSGNKSIDIKAIVFNDTLITHVSAHSIAPNYKLITTIYNFGTIDIKKTRTSLIPLLVNLNDNIITAEYLKLKGPDTTQYFINQIGENNYMLRNDTLFADIKFTGKLRGLSSTILNLKLEGIEDIIPIKLIGKVYSPRKYWLNLETLNRTDSMPLSTEIEITDLETGNLIFSGNTDTSGFLITELNPDRNYAVFAEKEGYLTSSANINLTENKIDSVINSTLYLPQIEPGAIIAMNCIFFEFSTDELLDESIPELNKILDFLKKHKNISVEIHGHTDSIGSKEYNINLSKRRAAAVLNFLISNGIGYDRLSIKAWGYEKPLADNNTENGRAQNRRVEIVVK